jgi:hypothetical protein
MILPSPHVSWPAARDAARFLTLSALLLLGSCSGHVLASCHGPIFPLNAGRWQPSGNDLAVQAETGL